MREVRLVVRGKAGSVAGAGVGADCLVCLWHWPQTASICRLDGHQAPAHTVDVSPDGQLLVSGGLDRTVRVWDPTARQLISTLGSLPGRVKDLAPE
jgi:WD40 repeat protein